ncbi:hypothetical protein UCDDS831_g02448 [Diplodia seriata]|uniref:Uncharacterized protein n=1 Tax=Diplodia seriata TaxID=420778 RepID=A0A0G2H6W1_9PEZI|nr:hypothetical protein UCDDS831_g02448 [Diplodia seriata]
MNACEPYQEYYSHLLARCRQLAEHLWPSRTCFCRLVPSGPPTARLYTAVIFIYGRGRPFSADSSTVDSPLDALLDLRRRLNLAVAALRRNPNVNRIDVVRRG